MKIYVVTTAKPLGVEAYEKCFSSFKSAEKYIRSIFPNARKDKPFGNQTSFLCKNSFGECLMFIHEEELQ